MINFKEFLLEKTNLVGTKTIEMLAQDGHEGTYHAADMLDGLHKIFSGKNSSIDTQVQHKGLSIQFGIHPKTKQFIISHDGKDNATFEDIDKNYNDENIKNTLKQAATHLPSILPKKSKMFVGKILYTKPDQIGVTVTHDNNGNTLKDSQRAKFIPSPTVFNMNPSVLANPTNYTPDKQMEYGLHMAEAKKAYSRLDPNITDYVSSHAPKLSKYIENSIKMGIKPDVKGYMNDLMQTYSGKIIRAKLKNNNEKQNNMTAQHAKLIDDINNNDKHFSGMINFLYHLHNASNVLKNVARNNNIANDIKVKNKDGVEATLKV